MSDELVEEIRNPVVRALMVRAIRSYHEELGRFADAFRREGKEPYATVNDMAILDWIAQELEGSSGE